MDIKLLKTTIKTNTIPKFLIFIGEEQTLARQYLQSIESTLGKYHKYFYSADGVLYEVNNNLKDDFLYIIFNDEKILKNSNYINELIKTDRNIILVFTEFDLKNQIYKEFKDYFVRFDKIEKYTLIAYLLKQLEKNKIEVSQDKLEQLVEYCNGNLGLCLNELDKIITLGQEKSNSLTDYMLKNGFSDYRQTNLFKFIQKLINKDITAFEDVQKLDESIVGLLTLLHKQTRSKLLNYDKVEYINILKLCSQLDSGIKDGTINADYALDYLMLKIL